MSSRRTSSRIEQRDASPASSRKRAASPKAAKATLKNKAAAAAAAASSSVKKSAAKRARKSASDEDAEWSYDDNHTDAEFKEHLRQVAESEDVSYLMTYADRLDTHTLAKLYNLVQSGKLGMRIALEQRSGSNFRAQNPHKWPVADDE
jgi:hypothetical protein